MIEKRVKDILKKVPPNVTVLAATKTRSVDEIRRAVDAGIKVIGENYVQEAYEKYNNLQRDVEWHLIGHLQKNKVKKACEIFDVIETVDSVKIADALSRRCANTDKNMDVLIEVNSGREEQKAGVLPEHVHELAEHIHGLENLHLVGLMTMGPAVGPEEIRQYFRLTAELYETLRKEYPEIRYLSMGMSDTWQVAVEEGANIIRLGTAIFGARKSKK